MRSKRMRGRPKGSSRYTEGDAKMLERVADLLVKEPNLKKTPAIARVVREAVLQSHLWDAAERRLLRRWEKTGEERLRAARERRDDAIREQRAMRVVPRMDGFGAVTGIAGVTEGLSAFAALQQAERALGSSALRQAMAALESPAMKLFSEHARQTQALRDLADPPALREFRRAMELIKRSSKLF